MHTPTQTSLLIERFAQLGSLRLTQFLVLLLVMTAPVKAQSYQDSVNFILTGSTAANSSTIVLPTGTIATKITGYDPATCTANETIALNGGYGALLLGYANIDSSDGVVILDRTVHFNAVSNWQGQMQFEGGAPQNYALKLDGTGELIFSGTVHTTDGRAVETPDGPECKSQCAVQLPPDVDYVRLDRALGYLYRSFCTGSHSAF